MNDRRRVTAPLVFLYQTECTLTIPKCTTVSNSFALLERDFSKGHIQMLISAQRHVTKWNCKTSRRPAFRDGPQFLAI